MNLESVSFSLPSTMVSRWGSKWMMGVLQFFFRHRVFGASSCNQWDGRIQMCMANPGAPMGSPVRCPASPAEAPRWVVLPGTAWSPSSAQLCPAPLRCSPWRPRRPRGLGGVACPAGSWPCSTGTSCLAGSWKLRKRHEQQHLQLSIDNRY